MNPNLLLHLHDLELALRRHAFQELSVADAIKLRKAFLLLKDRLLACVLPREPISMNKYFSLESMSDPSLPTSDIIEASENTLEAASNVMPKKEQVLLAEHDTKVAAFFIKHLQRAGFDVLWCSYANMAIKLIQNGNPSAILCSVYSRRSFGREVLTYVRNRHNTHIPAILIGGAHHSEALGQAISLGADDYMAQHITAAEVIGKIKRLLK